MTSSRRDDAGGSGSWAGRGITLAPRIGSAPALSLALAPSSPSYLPGQAAVLAAAEAEITRAQAQGPGERSSQDERRLPLAP